jgi:hypothetical protein
MGEQYSGKLNQAKIMAMLDPDKMIADGLDDVAITSIESDCQELYEKDYASCQDWRDDSKRLLQMAKLKDKSRSAYIKQWQADIQMPDIMFAAMQFNARTFPEYVKDGKVCQVKINGKASDEKQQRGKRVTDYMNWQLTEQMTEWSENFDKLLLILPIVGHAFKLTAYDDQMGRVTDMLLMPDMVTVDNTPNNPDWMRRISIDLTVNQNVVAANKASGAWRDVEIECDDQTAADKRYSIVQMHCWLDLDEDGYAEPYIVTLGKNDWKLLSIVPRYDADSLIWSYDPRNPADRYIIGIDAVEYITSYTYYPSPDGCALGMGIGHLIERLVKSRNSAINQIQDAGTKINMTSGLIRSGLFRDDGVIDFEPGEFKIMDAGFGSEDASKAIFPLPVNQPSAATFSVFETMGDTINRISQTGEIMSGEGVPANMPATSVLAIIEQGKVGQRVVLKRINISLSRELRAVYRLNRAYLNDAEYRRVLDIDANVSEDFDIESCDIAPVADPMFSTRVERLMRAQAAMQAGIQSPYLMKMYLIELGFSDEEAAQMSAGDAQAKMQAMAAQQQAELMDKQKDILKQQEATMKAHSAAMSQEVMLMEAKIRMAEMQSKLLLDRANTAKIMAETLQIETSAQLVANDALLREVASLPAAFPTNEELNDGESEYGEPAEPAEGGEGGIGRIQPMVAESGDESLPGDPAQSITETEPTDIPAGAIGLEPSTGTPDAGNGFVGDGEPVGGEGVDLPS